MTESFKAVKEQLPAAGLDFTIQQNLEIPGLIGEAKLYEAPDWSAAANAYSASCASLNHNPDKPLIESPVDMPEGMSTLEKRLVELLNNSLHKEPSAPNAFSGGYKSAKEDSCNQAEPNFVSALGYSKNSSKIKSNGGMQRIHVDENGDPVFFTKGGGFGCRTSLALASFAINGVEHPAGTIVYVKHDEFAEPLMDETVEIHSFRAIDSVHPLRFSLFGVPKDERFSMFVREGKKLANVARYEREEIQAHPSIQDIARFVTRYVDRRMPANIFS